MECNPFWRADTAVRPYAEDFDICFHPQRRSVDHVGNLDICYPVIWTEAGKTTKASRLLVRADTAVRPYAEFGFVTKIKSIQTKV
jgi:hypothetical protein